MSTIELLSDNQWIEHIRNPWLTQFFLWTPYLAHSALYFGWIGINHWRSSNYYFYKLGMLVCLATMMTYILKYIIQIPRPENYHLILVSDPFGFPSGDVLVATAFWWSLSKHYKKTSVAILSFTIVLLIMLARVYLGVHTLVDTLGGGFIGFMLAKVWWKYQSKLKNYPYFLYLWITSTCLLSVLIVKGFNFTLPFSLLIAIGASIGLVLGRILNDTYKINKRHFNHVQIIMHLIMLCILIQFFTSRPLLLGLLISFYIIFFANFISIFINKHYLR